MDVPCCANCGKGGDGLKTCTACKLVKYCNTTCQKQHRSKHKKECRKRASELFDEALFKKPPKCTECPICFLPLINSVTATFQPCCGKTLCNGCLHSCGVAGDYDARQCPCPFCRQSMPENEEAIELLSKRMDARDANAIHMLACQYDDGTNGVPKESGKALWLLAKELGSNEATAALGSVYQEGQGVKRDVKKAKYYYELAAVEGNVRARHTLARLDCDAGNINRAVKHDMIAASAGHEGLPRRSKE